MKRVSSFSRTNLSIPENNQRVNVTNRENSYTHKRDSMDSKNSLFAYTCNSKIDNKSTFKGASIKSSQQISSNLTQSLGQGGCVCGSRLTVCRGCRHLPRAPTVRRGGTLGFRPPEVMMRHIEQTTAVDIWAVGIIFISFLSGRYPFIKVDDDLDVLHAFTHLIGYERMQMGARSIGRRLLLDPRPPPMEASDSPVVWLKTRCSAIRLYEKKFAGLPPLLRKTTIKSTNDNSIQTTELSNGKPMIALSSTHIFPTSAYDLLARLLEPCPKKRITALDALHHPYFCNIKTQRHSSIPLKYPNIQSNSLFHKRTSRSSLCESTTNFIPRPQFC
ncbi:unnamed protein product [Schistosoma margrebowiei]|nr:unnamed protein product [Schistosoma margrebowiei]